MKKMWNMRKDAVSPVIATILMVAITVVLAAVLYVMVMGFGGGGGATPTASFQNNRSDPGWYNFTVLSVSKPDVKISDIQIICVGPAGATFTVDSGMTSASSSSVVGAGDYFGAHFTTLGVQYTITVKYIPTNNAIATISLTPS